MNKIYPIETPEKQEKQNDYTKDRYALYLRQKIGTGMELEKQNTKEYFETQQENQKFSDEWIQLYKFIYIKSVAMAEKCEEDLYLKIGEFWIVIITMQFITSLIIVSGPSIYKFFYFRLISYIILYQIYLPILFWTLFNTKYEHVQKPWAALMRIFLGLPQIAIFAFIFIRCPSFENQIVMFVLFVFYFVLELYAENLVSSENLDFQMRLKTAVMQSSASFDLVLSFLLFVKLIILSKRAIYFVFLGSTIVGAIPEILEIIAQKNFPRHRVKLLSCVLVCKMLKLIFLFVILSNLISGGISTGGFGILQMFVSVSNLLYLVYRICQVSTENLLEKINQEQDDQ